jgi:hypothetical protein
MFCQPESFDLATMIVIGNFSSIWFLTEKLIRNNRLSSDIINQVKLQSASEKKFIISNLLLF